MAGRLRGEAMTILEFVDRHWIAFGWVTLVGSGIAVLLAIGVYERLSGRRFI